MVQKCNLFSFAVSNDGKYLNIYHDKKNCRPKHSATGEILLLIGWKQKTFQAENGSLNIPKYGFVFKSFEIQSLHSKGFQKGGLALTLNFVKCSIMRILEIRFYLYTSTKAYSYYIAFYKEN